MILLNKTFSALLLVMIIFTGNSLFSYTSESCSCSDNSTETQFNHKCCDSMTDETMSQCHKDSQDNNQSSYNYYDTCNNRCHFDIPKVRYLSNDTYTNQRNLLKVIGILNSEPLLKISLNYALPFLQKCDNTTNSLVLLKTVILIV